MFEQERLPICRPVGKIKVQKKQMWKMVEEPLMEESTGEMGLCSSQGTRVEINLGKDREHFFLKTGLRKEMGRKEFSPERRKKKEIEGSLARSSSQ